MASASSANRTIARLAVERRREDARVRLRPERIRFALRIAATNDTSFAVGRFRRTRDATIIIERRRSDLRDDKRRAEAYLPRRSSWPSASDRSHATEARTAHTLRRNGRAIDLESTRDPSSEFFTAAVQHAERERLQRQGRVVPWVFFRMVALGRRGPLRPRRIISFNKAFKTACVRSGVPGHILHDFRRTAVRNLERAGVPRSVAMKLTGHKTESVYRRYPIADDRDLRVAVERLDAVAILS